MTKITFGTTSKEKRYLDVGDYTSWRVEVFADGNSIGALLKTGNAKEWFWFGSDLIKGDTRLGTRLNHAKYLATLMLSKGEETMAAKHDYKAWQSKAYEGMPTKGTFYFRNTLDGRNTVDGVVTSIDDDVIYTREGAAGIPCCYDLASFRRECELKPEKPKTMAEEVIYLRSVKDYAAMALFRPVKTQAGTSESSVLYEDGSMAVMNMATGQWTAR